MDGVEVEEEVEVEVKVKVMRGREVNELQGKWGKGRNLNGGVVRRCGTVRDGAGRCDSFSAPEGGAVRRWGAVDAEKEMSASEFGDFGLPICARIALLFLYTLDKRALGSWSSSCFGREHSSNATRNCIHDGQRRRLNSVALRSPLDSSLCCHYYYY
jgi:hypothetical protein